MKFKSSSKLEQVKLNNYFVRNLISGLFPTPGSKDRSQKTEAHIPPLMGVAPLGPVPLNKDTQLQYAMLERAFLHMPCPSDYGLACGEKCCQTWRTAVECPCSGALGQGGQRPFKVGYGLQSSDSYPIFHGYIAKFDYIDRLIIIFFYYFRFVSYTWK